MEKMTIKQLKEVATRKGLKFISKITKPDLLKLLKDAEKPAKEGPKSSGEY